MQSLAELYNRVVSCSAMLKFVKYLIVSRHVLSSNDMLCPVELCRLVAEHKSKFVMSYGVAPSHILHCRAVQS